MCVFGGSGFIGRHTINLLNKRGYEVMSVDTSPQQPQDVQRHVCDTVLNVGHVTKELNHFGPQGIVFLPAQMGFTNDYPRYMQNPKYVSALWSILEQCHTVDRVVLASSQAVYGRKQHRDLSGLRIGMWDQDESLPYTEEFTPNPESVYGLSKLMQEQVATVMASKLGLKLSMLRYSIVVGPGQEILAPYAGVVRSFAAAAVNNVPAVIFEDGLQLRDLVHVSDVAHANVAALESDREYGVYNVTSDEPMNVTEIWRAVNRSLGVHSPVRALVPGCWRSGDTRHCVSLGTLARDEIGFTPMLSPGAAIADYCKWLIASGEASKLLQSQFADPQEALTRQIAEGSVLTCSDFSLSTSAPPSVSQG